MQNRNIAICGHLGLGDIINCNGLIRYYSNLYNFVLLFCKRKYLQNISQMFNDKTNIIYYCQNRITNELIDNIYNIAKALNDDILFKNFNILLLGDLNRTKKISYLFHNRQSFQIETIKFLPFNFYIDANISPKIFWTHFKCNDTNESIELYKQLNNNIGDKKICFIENYSSYGKLYNIDILLQKHNLDLNNLFLVVPNDPEYNNEFSNKLLIDYKKILENSDYIFVSDSAFFCLCLHLNLKKTCKFFVLTRDLNINYSYFYNNKLFSPPDEILKDIVEFRMLDYRNYN